MAGKIFINYRRVESLGEAQSLYAHLLRHFPENRLFMDRHGIEHGKDWLLVIEKQIAASEFMLVLIGKDWVNIRNEQDHRRIDDDADFVRFEIAGALRRNIDVLPILLNGAVMPRREELPPNLLSLANIHAIALRLESFQEDANRIATWVKRKRWERIRWKWLLAGICFTALLLGTFGGPWVLSRAGLPIPGIEISRDDGELRRLKDRLEQSESKALVVPDLDAKVARLETQIAEANDRLAKSRAQYKELDERRLKELGEQKVRHESAFAREKEDLDAKVAQATKQLAEARSALARLTYDLRALDERRSKELAEQKSTYEAQIATLKQDAVAAAKRPSEPAPQDNAPPTTKSATSCFDASSSDPESVIRLCTLTINQRRDRLSHERALNRRGLAFHRTNRLEEALRDFDALIASNKLIGGYFDNRKAVYRDLGNLDMALKDASESIRVAPKFSWYYKSRAELLVEAARFDEAIADYTKAISLRDKDSLTAVFYYDRGRIYAKVRKLDLAIRDFTSALDKDASLVLSLRERGLANIELGSLSKAEQDLTQYLRDNPEDKDVQRILEEIKVRKK